MGTEIQPAIWNSDKWVPFCQKPLEIQAKMTRFWLVQFSNGWTTIAIAVAKAFEIKPSKSLDFKCFSVVLSLDSYLILTETICLNDLLFVIVEQNTFGSLEKIVNASVEDLTLCPGFGPQKAQRLNKVLKTPFKKWKTLIFVLTFSLLV